MDGGLEIPFENVIGQTCCGTCTVAEVKSPAVCIDLENLHFVLAGAPFGLDKDFNARLAFGDRVNRSAGGGFAVRGGGCGDGRSIEQLHFETGCAGELAVVGGALQFVRIVGGTGAHRRAGVAVGEADFVDPVIPHDGKDHGHIRFD